MVGVLSRSLKDIGNGGRATQVVEGHQGCQKMLIMFLICVDQISCSQINRSGNGLMDNLYHHGLPMSINELSFFQNHLILKYINI